MRIIIVIASLLLLLMGANLIISHKVKDYLYDELNNVIQTSTHDLYRMKIGNVDLDLVSGSVEVKDIRLQLNHERFNYLNEVDSLPEFYGSAKIESVKLAEFNYIKFFLAGKRKLTFNKLHINNPVCYAFHQEKEKLSDPAKTDTIKKNNQFPDLYRMIAPYFDEVSINKISTSGGKLIYSNQRNIREASLEVNLYGLGFAINKLKISAKENPVNKILYTDNVFLLFDSISTVDPKQLYVYSAGKGKIDMKNSSVYIQNLGLTSTVPKWEYAYKHPTHADWFDVKIGSLRLTNVDFNKLLDNRTFIADSLFINKVSLQNMKNTTIRITHNVMPMIYEQVHDIPLNYAIDYVNLSGMDVVYEELPKNGNPAGKIFFTDLRGVYDQGITNIPLSHEQTNHLTASGKLMGVGLINAEMEFPVDSTYDHFTMKGTLGAMSLVSLNPIIEPLASAKLEKGYIQKMDFNIVGGRKKAVLDMVFRYNDLSFALLRGKKDHHTKKGFLSFVANGIIKKDNPSGGENVRKVKVTHIRDPYHSSFNYLWKILIDGLIPSVGITEQDMKTIGWVTKTYQELNN